MTKETKPLSGIRILDFSQYLPGPLCTQHLGDLGADVIKIENRKGGDLSRPTPDGSTSQMFLKVNRNKRSLAVDLRQPEGIDIIRRLVKEVDVLVEGFRPGVMDKLGLGYGALSALNPRLVYCAITGYGQDGPFREFGGHDINYQSLSGVLEQSGAAGGPPAPGGFQIADIAGGSLTSAMSILAALVDAQRSGQGRFVDVSMTDAALACMVMGLSTMDSFGNGRPLPRGEDYTNGRLPCYGVYETADGRHVALGALEPQFWQAFCTAVARPDLMAKGWALGAEGETAKAEIAALIKDRSLQAWSELLFTVDGCATPVLRLDEVLEHPLTRARGMVHEGLSPEGKPYRQFAFPAKMSGYQFSVDRNPPALGEHNDELLKSLGYGDEEIAALHSRNVA
ncbi:CaiB/BaiF CoA transferase family protein [Denitratisoma oestradiolicum]|uniref:Alpha-methylacyl-CoA racemase n=1 Tax=Denitratisoma oestradiolicum TaxID=311182 RepID=A0A6S6XZW5_9PROT|nr:CaiB/BaiF CoA-transferase family protein [Denitratisoma oestradiolicum]TWO79978.1 carnitine dehydratase [Denitratisoma oestradiolicum]CAB1369741.1 Alpha-methylacyl-CoA racemase [Denitratisoma oestradiolicum]